VVWGAVCQRNILLVSSVGCLKIEVACLYRTVSIPDDLVPVWKDTISVLFRMKCHEWKGDVVWYGIVVL
jgi:hypothetical protein